MKNILGFVGVVLTTFSSPWVGAMFVHVSNLWVLYTVNYQDEDSRGTHPTVFWDGLRARAKYTKAKIGIPVSPRRQPC